MILDDFDSRRGSATSLLRTLIGVCLRRVGGQIAVSDLISLMAVVGVGTSDARAAISRVKAKGLLTRQVKDRKSSYLLTPNAVALLERGDRRIYGYRQMADGDPWCLLSFSIPESRRDIRYQLRKRMTWIGCGMVATGLWICPGHLAGELKEIVSDLGVDKHATFFVTGTPSTAGSLAQAARAWWNLDHLAQLHRDFLDAHGSIPSDARPEDSFRILIAAIDRWRALPYLDPGLPPAMLPSDWPGYDSVALFAQITATHSGPAHAFLSTVVDHAETAAHETR